MRRGIAECLLDLVQCDGWIGRQHMLNHGGDPADVTGSIGHLQSTARFEVKHGGRIAPIVTRRGPGHALAQRGAAGAGLTYAAPMRSSL